MKIYDVVAMGKSNRELMILRRSETPRTPVIDDPRIVEGIDYRPQIVCRTVIGYNDFEVGYRLCEGRLDCLFQTLGGYGPVCDRILWFRW